MEALNKLLQNALKPEEEPDICLNRTILQYAKMREETQRKRRGYPAAVFLAALLAAGTCLTACVAWRYLSPIAVAEEMNDRKLAEAFEGENALWINETQSCGGYDITFLGIVSGEGISDYLHGDGNGESVSAERTYAVVAIENSDGTPMPDTSEDAYGEMNFFVSPLIGGCRPDLYNIVTMNGAYTEISREGILYRLVDCDTIEIFADHELYLCVSEGSFYDRERYHYDLETGEISRNEAYGGLNVLFSLPLDKAGADKEKAQAYMAYMESIGLTEGEWSVPSPVAAEEIPVLSEGSGSQAGIQAAEYALSFVGTPYEWGAADLEKGTDSSGFTRSVFAHFEIALPHAAGEQREYGQAIEELSDAQPGDLIFYDKPSHVAIYLGDGKIVHALPDYGVCVTEADYAEWTAIRRIVEDK